MLPTTTPPPPTPAQADLDLDRAVAVFAELAPRLHAIAYRIVGNWREAEDIVQDAWVRWQTCDRTAVRNSTAFLVTVTTRLAINSSRSARSRRESPVSEWYTEPIDPAQDPTVGPERADELARGVHHLLGRLSPTERAAFVLRHGFDLPYETIAASLHLTEANTRQVVSRAGKHLTSRPARAVELADQQRLVDAFRLAAERGDVTILERALAA